jgi:hypothetical protein
MVVFEKGGLMTGAGVKVVDAVVELEAPSSEEAPVGIIVVNVEEKVTGTIVAVVKEVSVLVPWDEVELATAERLEVVENLAVADALLLVSQSLISSKQRRH